MAFNGGSVTNTGAYKKVISDASNNSFVAEGDNHGNSRVTDSSGITEFTPNVHTTTTIMDRFVSVGGDDNMYVKGTKETRVDNGDLVVFVGPSDALIADAYNRWATEFAKLAAANLLPDTKIPAYPILQGVDYNNLGR
jgi:hypothetical protein